MLKVLVCGSRTFKDAPAVFDVLEGVVVMRRYFTGNDAEEFIVIEGGAAGADTFARNWVEAARPESPIRGWTFPADWEKHDKAAGPRRNQQMLDEGQPDRVYAFIDKPLEESKGTADMVSRAVAARIPTYVIQKMGV